MTVLLPVAGLLLAAAITPGPNNFIVFEAAARGGFAAAVRVILGVVIGTLLLLALVSAGIDAAMSAAPAIRIVLSVAGAVYLAWLGAAMLRPAARSASSSPQRSLPSSILGVAAFQLFNPKAWVLVATAAAAIGSGSVVLLAVLIVIVTSLCLFVWTLCGKALARVLERRRPRLWFDRSMGVLLALSAGAVIVDALG